jgi:hypothetical protein
MLYYKAIEFKLFCAILTKLSFFGPQHIFSCCFKFPLPFLPEHSLPHLEQLLWLFVSAGVGSPLKAPAAPTAPNERQQRQQRQQSANSANRAPTAPTERQQSANSANSSKSAI